MPPGKTIRIYLADGTASGIRHGELVNWTGQAVVAPRGRVAELAEWAECQRPGVYVLFGDEGEAVGERAYIGEAENVFQRLKQHLATKEFWTRVVIVTSKDDNLTKAHVKYLESRMVTLAREAGRYPLGNGNAPQLPSLPRSERDAMDEFLGSVNLLLSALGFPVLQPVGRREPVSGDAAAPTALAPELRFTNAKRGVEATGASRDDGFAVFAGSVGSAEIREHLGKGSIALRERLLLEGSLRIEGSRLLVTKDILFPSPSSAAAILAGGAYNGREAWRTESGVTLKELEEAMVANASGPEPR
jgi:hypothetical protein